MCRIAGIISRKLDAGQRQAKVALMCDALKHGGPDDEGVYPAPDTGLTFGHRRLSIIDLTSNGHQPMADVSQKAWITFNGEIYNYLELRGQLIKAGAIFKSDTDTEVIIQAYLHWGTEAFGRLRGMFAFALYDIDKALVYLVRDTAGIKPLYYYIEDGDLSFASETKALKAAGIATQDNPQWVIKFLAYGHVPEPYTTLNNVFSLPKGQMLRWDIKTSSTALTPYNVNFADAIIDNLADAQLALENGLKTAIQRQLMADAPIGVFLSGGIDSSLLTLLAAQQKQQGLKTVSIFFDEKQYDESAFQQDVFKHISGEKFTHLVSQQDFNEFFPDVIAAMDMPTTDGINSWFISKYARQDGLKAVLSGVGADELFGGYPSFNRIAYIKYLRGLPKSLIRAFIKSAPDRFKKLLFLTSDHVLADYLFLRALYTPPDIAAILNCDESEVYAALFSDENILNTGRYDKQAASWLETNLYMQNQLLRDTDVMSMSHGLEVRVPFLDEDFHQIANSISPHIRFDKNQPKKILISTFKNILPKAVWDRPKMGFSFPLQQWMKNHPAITNPGLYHNKEAKSIITAFNNNQVHWSKAFALYQIQPHV